MGDVRLTFEDGSVVRLHLAAADGVPGPAEPVESNERREAGPELPPDFGGARPVSADGRTVRSLTRGGQALAGALRPLGNVLGGIHSSFSSLAHRPDEVSVEFGVTLGSDLSLGVFSGSGEASFTVSATWNLDARRPAPGPAAAPDPDRVPGA